MNEKISLALTIVTSNDSETEKVRKLGKLKLTDSQIKEVEDKLGSMAVSDKVKKKLTTEDKKMKLDKLLEGFDLNEKVNVRGNKKEEASPNPSRLEKDGNKLTPEYKKEIQQEVDKNTEILLKELDTIIEDFESFRSKYKKMVSDEGKRRQGESAVRFGGRWKKMATIYNKVEDMIVSLKKLRQNY